MQILEYINNNPTYYFSCSVDKQNTTSFSITKPVIKKDDLQKFLNILDTKTYGKIEIQTQSPLILIITSGYDLFLFDYRIEGTNILMQLSLKYTDCKNPIREFINDLLQEE